MTVVIGICGAAGTGKSTVADYLARSYGARVYALANPLKEIVRRAFSLSNAQVYGTQAEKEAVDPRYNVSPRWLMQRIGTEGIRYAFGDDFWVKYTLQQIERDAPPLAVIEDVRFVSEAYHIGEWPDGYKHERSSYIWKLSTPWQDSKADKNHQSEAENSKIIPDHVITPSVKVLANLYDAVDRACERFDVTPVLHSIEAP